MHKRPNRLHTLFLLEWTGRNLQLFSLFGIICMQKIKTTRNLIKKHHQGGEHRVGDGEIWGWGTQGDLPGGVELGPILKGAVGVVRPRDLGKGLPWWLRW